jgi:hypothetical protein
MKIFTVAQEQPGLGRRVLLSCKPNEPLFKPEYVLLVCDKCGQEAAGKVLTRPIPSRNVIARHLCTACDGR